MKEDRRSRAWQGSTDRVSRVGLGRAVSSEDLTQPPGADAPPPMALRVSLVGTRARKTKTLWVVVHKLAAWDEALAKTSARRPRRRRDYVALDLSVRRIRHLTLLTTGSYIDSRSRVTDSGSRVVAESVSVSPCKVVTVLWRGSFAHVDTSG
jgi:hypothetical protein